MTLLRAVSIKSSCVALGVSGVLTFAGCSSSSSGGSTPVDSGTKVDTGTGDAAVNTSLCVKYATALNTTPAGLVTALNNAFIQSVNSDCAISSFFTALAPATQTHLQACLYNFFSSALSCPTGPGGAAFAYTGSSDEAGAPCLDMVTAHRSLSITSGDYSSLITDLITVATAAGVTTTDIGTIGAALEGSGTTPGIASPAQIVTSDAGGNSRSVCTDAGSHDGATGG